ncbi:peptidylprolyl isomerase [Luteithermobacter gelatinilyticus]|uniref:peptidylprolyl isomerase n=1 Tax=Luteithermobacter gelatinilyticus TaxID=2582913 RepID=UPI00143DBED9|nr:peptidylprolyl isomerase [Luteithermobacter gelatinilyticus]
MFGRVKIFVKIVLCAVLGSHLFLAQAAQAQQAQAQQLDDVQQIVAIVNDQVISLYDLKQRVLLFIISSGMRELSAQEQQYLQQQALQSLIDDKLKIAEAAKYKAVISKEEQEEAFASYAKQFNLSPEEFEKQLNQAGIDKKSMLQQIEASLAWEQVVGGLLMPQVSVTDEEIYNVIERFESNKGQDEYLAREIFLLVTDNDRREETRQAALQIIEQLEKGAAFQVMARQFSQSTTSAVGGDMGWVMKTELPKEIASALSGMKKGEISDPIETEDGFYILQLVNKRQILTPSPEDTTVTLKHMFFQISDQAEAEEVKALEKAVQEASGKIDGCENVEALAEDLDAKDSGTLGTLKIGDMPERLHTPLLETAVGKATAPLKESGGYRIFIVCDKKAPEVQVPDYETVQNTLTNQRVGLIARRHLRDLRRDAIIDYR